MPGSRGEPGNQANVGEQGTFRVEISEYSEGADFWEIDCAGMLILRRTI